MGGTKYCKRCANCRFPSNCYVSCSSSLILDSNWEEHSKTGVGCFFFYVGTWYIYISLICYLLYIFEFHFLRKWFIVLGDDWNFPRACLWVSRWIVCNYDDENCWLPCKRYESLSIVCHLGKKNAVPVGRETCLTSISIDSSNS